MPINTDDIVELCDNSAALRQLVEEKNKTIEALERRTEELGAEGAIQRMWDSRLAKRDARIAELEGLLRAMPRPTKQETIAIMNDCNRRYQRCSECPALGCYDADAGHKISQFQPKPCKEK